MIIYFIGVFFTAILGYILYDYYEKFDIKSNNDDFPGVYVILCMFSWVSAISLLVCYRKQYKAWYKYRKNNS